MALYPFTPVPASTSAPTLIDPALLFETDQGYTLRRSQHSRPRRRYQLTYLGLTTADMRIIREFLQEHRLNVLPFEWKPNNDVYDTATVGNTTPMTLTFRHTYVTGQWVYCQGISIPSFVGSFRVQKLSPTQLALEGTTAIGPTTAYVQPYLPTAVGVVEAGTLEAPVKLIGPESADTPRGRWNLLVTIEEVF